jgi:hypothetical protein
MKIAFKSFENKLQFHSNIYANHFHDKKLISQEALQKVFV